MKVDVKPEHAETGAREESLIPQFANWVEQGTENFLAAQKILLDLVMRQNAMAMTALKERLTAKTPGPGSALREAAGEGFVNFIAAQKILLNLAREQNEIVMTGVKERVGASTPTAAMTDLLRRSVETFIDLQQHFLEVASKQAKAFVHAAKTGEPYAGKSFGDLAKEGMETFAQTQKKYLDLIAEETAKATKEAKPAEKAAKKTDLTELARQSAEAFIEAQKELLDTASRQMELNIKEVNRTLEAFAPPAGTPLVEMTRQGVANFVAAQKALLDVMVKPPETAKGVHPKVHARAAERRVHVN